ncbi:MAG TPA: hypothetical protein ENG87_04760 [Candidatus Pacearchaeota archaeon]|nr:hypothetical protein BMS3Abin17_00808 [archaeon BMS3Abin17]HDK42668.1 hypothetical protein [Candidatus Pacearchaeota archaeon]HDZ60097.1 hypothetical protein [Candidatus Pacearchaeota archaeon]
MSERDKKSIDNLEETISKFKKEFKKEFKRGLVELTAYSSIAFLFLYQLYQSDKEFINHSLNELNNYGKSLINYLF